MAVFTGSSSITAKNSYLEEHPQITRMPTTQGEWNGFIQALQRWRYEYEGTFTAGLAGFDVGSPFTVDFSFTYYRFGKIVAVTIDAQEAVSNNTSLASSAGALPTVIRPSQDQQVPMVGLVDNGTPVASCGQVKVFTTGQVSFGIDNNLGGFTASGNKGFGDQDGNTFIYTLFDAKKID